MLSSFLRQVVGFFFIITSVAIAQTPSREAWILDIKGAIGPGVSDYIVRNITLANTQSIQFIVLRLDTPGGLDAAMRDIIQAILASNVPIISYVSPQGARAASAGTFILYASHIAAMSPATNLGAATPVQIGGAEQQNPQPDNTEKDVLAPQSKLENKVINDAVAYIRGLAELRQRNADWAEQAVRFGRSLSASEALKMQVIDVVAADVDELLIQINAKKISVANVTKILDTQNITLIEKQPDWRSKFLAFITDPSIAYLFMLLGFYGILFEFYNPGFGIPGVMGAISLLIAAYAFHLLPVNYVGLGLILLGIIFIIAEVFTATFGILALGGGVAFIVGSIMLIDTDIPGLEIALPVIYGVTLVTIVIIIGTITLAMRARKQKVVSGVGTMLGKTVEVRKGFTTEGQVYFGGELWRAKTDQPLEPGDRALIRDCEGLTLLLTKQEDKT